MQSVQDNATAPTHVLVIGGKSIVDRLQTQFLRDLEKYNKRLELLKSPIRLCDKHKSNGKEYHGRYFKERYYDPVGDVIKWRYIGTHVPEDYVPQGGFPHCPENPLEGWDGQVIDDCVILRPEIYERLIDHFVGSFVVPINWSDAHGNGRVNAVEATADCIHG
jgi:hypothetical protein